MALICEFLKPLKPLRTATLLQFPSWAVPLLFVDVAHFIRLVGMAPVTRHLAPLRERPMRAVVSQISIGNPLQIIQRTARAASKASYRYVLIPMLKRKDAYLTEFVNRDPYRALQMTAHLGCHPIYSPLDTMRGTASHGRIAKLRIPRQIEQEHGSVVDCVVVLISHVNRQSYVAPYSSWIIWIVNVMMLVMARTSPHRRHDNRTESYYPDERQKHDNPVNSTLP